VDRYGYVLPYRLSAASLPLIKGLDEELQLGVAARHADVEIALQMIAICDSDSELRKYIRIESLDLHYSDYIHMYLSGGTRVRMPRHSVRKKLVNLSSLIKIGLARGERFKEIDMTLDTLTAPAVPF
jgi:hypothetical protein